ncbi:MAG: hypothetical protein HDS40_05045 [Bacteroides sp.]|nr:hypothetical protein [Bacteroides sp.]
MKTAKLHVRKKVYALPVSRKFYQDLMARLEDIIKAVCPVTYDECLRAARRMVDYYLNDNLDALPKSAIIPEVNIIFLTLKAEIDSARLRSERARLAALSRRAVRAAVPAPGLEEAVVPAGECNRGSAGEGEVEVEAEGGVGGGVGAGGDYGGVDGWSCR